jgi:hypothetical protein
MLSINLSRKALSDLKQWQKDDEGNRFCTGNETQECVISNVSITI